MKIVTGADEDTFALARPPAADNSGDTAADTNATIDLAAPPA